MGIGILRTPLTLTIDPFQKWPRVARWLATSGPEDDFIYPVFGVRGCPGKMQCNFVKRRFFSGDLFSFWRAGYPGRGIVLGTFPSGGLHVKEGQWDTGTNSLFYV